MALCDVRYQGIEIREENCWESVTRYVALKPAKRKALPNNKLGRMAGKREHVNALVRVELVHPFYVEKNRFRHRWSR